MQDTLSNRREHYSILQHNHLLWISVDRRARGSTPSLLHGTYTISYRGFYDHDQYPDQLEVLLRIWLSSLTLFPAYDKPEQFLLVLGHHLEALPQLLTPICVILLASIYEKHSLSTKTHFLKYIAWSGLPAKSNC